MTLRIPNARRSAVSALALGVALATAACAATGATRTSPVKAVTPQASIVTDATRAQPALWPRAASPA
ncbi:hypothetical protein, partial [Brevundimonas sp.]|uniref:hypothetical protein n=1 Tax=Brevundimonas sp. TaxID=1871086 RepID=UPI0028B1F612